MRRPIIWLAVLITGVLAFMLACAVFLPRLLYPPLSQAELQGVPTVKERIELQQAQSQLQSNVRTPLLQGLGALLLIGGLVATWQQVRISREGQITDRFTNAINQLGNENRATRIGGIFALERIARESKQDRSAIAYTLATFIRDSQPASAVRKQSYVRMLKIRAPDAQAAIMVLCRSPLCDDRVNANITDLHNLDRTDLRLDLSRTDLRRVSLSGARLDGVNLWGSRLEGANLRGANLRAAGLSDANLGLFDPKNMSYEVGADLSRANLTGAYLSGADLSSANLEGAILDEVTDLHLAKITDATRGLPTRPIVSDRSSG
jgi:uncharacterized protein YjbI with pentapeptide repeats